MIAIVELVITHVSVVTNSQWSDVIAAIYYVLLMFSDTLSSELKHKRCTLAVKEETSGATRSNYIILAPTDILVDAR